MLKEKSYKNIYICQIWGQANLEAKSEANFEARLGFRVCHVKSQWTKTKKLKEHKESRLYTGKFRGFF